MSLGYSIVVGLAILWVIGWLATARDISSLPGTSIFNRAMGIAILFFIWPAVAWAMANSRH